MTTDMNCSGCGRHMTIEVTSDGPTTVVSVLCDRCTRKQEIREASVNVIRASLDVFRVHPALDEDAALDAYIKEEIGLEDLARRLQLPFLVLPVPTLEDFR